MRDNDKKRALTERVRNASFEKHPHIFTDKRLNTQDQKTLGHIIPFKRKDLWINHLIVPLDKGFLQLMSASETAPN